MWVLALQLGNRCKAAFLAIDYLVIVGPVINSLVVYKSVNGIHGFQRVY
jgi:hypothetical protein